MTLVATPTFVLKKIDPIRIIDEYKNGLFKKLVLPTMADKIIISSPITPPSMIGDSFNDDIHSYRDKNNNSHIFASTNCNTFSLYRASTGKPSIGEWECDRCREEFRGTALGIPIRMETRKNANNLEYRFFFDKVACSFECAYGILKRETGLCHSYRDPLYTSSEQMLIFAFSLAYPGKKLKESPDPRLLKRKDGRGGSLSSSEYHSGHHIYVQTPNLVFVPVKSEYLRLPVRQN